MKDKLYDAGSYALATLIVVVVMGSKLSAFALVYAGLWYHSTVYFYIAIPCWVVNIVATGLVRSYDGGRRKKKKK